jgi:hypothetical protein
MNTTVKYLFAVLVFLVIFQFMGLVWFDYRINNLANIVDKNTSTLNNLNQEALANKNSKSSVPSSPLSPSGEITQPASTVYVSQRGSLIYHIPTCQYALYIPGNLKDYYFSQEEARLKGNNPCWYCIK